MSTKKVCLCLFYYYLYIIIKFLLFQTFHTPSFGDEEFDIPLIHGQHATNTSAQNTHIQYTQLHHSAPQVGINRVILFFIKIIQIIKRLNIFRLCERYYSSFYRIS